MKSSRRKRTEPTPRGADRRLATEPHSEAERPVSVVIPCYNEVATIRTVLQRVSDQPHVGEIIVVDDDSADGTREVLDRLRQEWPASRPPLRVFHQPRNAGKGAALRVGFSKVQGPITLIQDADLEYDPRDYPKLIQPILDGDADVVYGSRFEGFPRRAWPGHGPLCFVRW